MFGYQILINNNIIHQDLKPSNILQHENYYKLADFGVSIEVDDYLQWIYTQAGTPLF